MKCSLTPPTSKGRDMNSPLKTALCARNPRAASDPSHQKPWEFPSQVTQSTADHPVFLRRKEALPFNRSCTVCISSWGRRNIPLQLCLKLTWHIHQGTDDQPLGTVFKENSPFETDEKISQCYLNRVVLWVLYYFYMWLSNQSAVHLCW